MSTDSIRDEITRLMTDAFWTEKAHFTLAGWWRAAHLVIGLIATIASAVAGAVIIAESSKLVAGLAALVATLAAGLLTFLKPNEIGQSHLASGRRLGSLRVEMRQTRSLDLPNRPPDAEIRSRIQEFAKKKAEIDEAAPHVSNLAVHTVERRHARGDYGDMP